MRAYPVAVSIERERAEARRRAREAEEAAAAVRRRAPWPAAREVRRRRWSPPPRYWLATTVRAEKRAAAERLRRREWAWGAEQERAERASACRYGNVSCDPPDRLCATCRDALDAEWRETA